MFCFRIAAGIVEMMDAAVGRVRREATREAFVRFSSVVMVSSILRGHGKDGLRRSARSFVLSDRRASVRVWRERRERVRWSRF